MPLMAISFLASCGQSKEYVTITFDSGIGTFEDSNIIKTLTVKAGTKLSDCEIDRPIFVFENIDYDSIKKEMEYWSNENGERVAENCTITNDISITANYYPIADIKSLCIGVAMSSLAVAYAQKQTEDFEEFVQNYIETSMGYKNSSQPIGCCYIVLKTAYIYPMRGSEALTYSNEIINYLEDAIDYRAQVIGKIGGALVEKRSQYYRDDLTEFCYNYLFDFVKKVKYEYVPWADILCSSALQNVFEIYARLPSDEIKEVICNDTAFFSNSINISKDSNIAYQISLIGAKFYEDIAKEEVNLETINRIFEEAKEEVEELL